MVCGGLQLGVSAAGSLLPDNSEPTTRAEHLGNSQDAPRTLERGGTVYRMKPRASAKPAEPDPPAPESSPAPDAPEPQPSNSALTITAHACSLDQIDLATRTERAC